MTDRHFLPREARIGGQGARVSPAAAACLFLAACGGAEVVATGPATSQPAGNGAIPSPPPPAGGGAAAAPPVAGGPPAAPPVAGGPPATGTTGVAVFAEALSLGPSERAGLEREAGFTARQFDALNMRPLGALMDVPTLGTAQYSGGVLMRLGSEEKYLSGSMTKTINLFSGEGTGRIERFWLSGNDTTRSPLGLGDTLQLTVRDAFGSDFSGTITGTVNDNFVTGESYSIDSTVDGRFVEAGGVPETIGTVRGTVTTSGGTQPLDGILYGNLVGTTN